MLNQLSGFEAIRLQRVAGIHNIDDLVGQTKNRRQLHGAIQLDDVCLATLGRIISAGQIDEFRGHLDTTGWRSLIFRTGGHQAATGNIQIQRLIQPFPTVLHQHVLASHAKIRTAVLNIGRHIRGADDQHPDIRVRCREHQFAGLFDVVDQLNARLCEQRQGFFQDSSLRQGDGDGICHGFFRFPVLSGWISFRLASVGWWRPATAVSLRYTRNRGRCGKCGQQWYRRQPSAQR